MSDKNKNTPVAERSSGKVRRDAAPNVDIGFKLKQYYDSILTEEVPDRFAQLLGELEQVEKKTDGN